MEIGISLSLTSQKQGGGVARLPIYPEAYGAVGDGVTDDSVALQSWIDAVGGANATDDKYEGRSTVGKTYLSSKTLFMRRDKTYLRCVGSVLKLPAAVAVSGSLLAISNIADWSVTGGTWDVNGNYENAIVAIGLHTEFPEVTVYNPAKLTQRGLIDGVTTKNAKFHINKRQGIRLKTSNPAPVGTFVVGETIDSIDESLKSTTAIVVQHDTTVSPPVLYADWTTNRVGTSGTATGRTSGASAAQDTVRVNVNVTEPISGISFAPWNGKFGGKGISIQRATANIEVKNCEVIDCDNGFTLEAVAPGGGEDTFARGVTAISIHDCKLTRVSRCPFWISNAYGGSYDRQMLNADIRNIEIVDPLAAVDRFGIFNGDRAHDIVGRNISVTCTPGYVAPLNGWPAVLGSWGKGTDIQMFVSAPKMDSVIDARTHARWGNAPGTFAAAQGEPKFDISVDVATLATGPLIFLGTGVAATPNAQITLRHRGWNAAAKLNSTDATISLALYDLNAGTSYTGPASTTTPVYA